MGGGAIGTAPPKTPYYTTPSTGLPSSSTSPPPNPGTIFPVSASYSSSLRPRTSVSCRASVDGGARARAGAGGDPNSSSVFGPVPSQPEIDRAIASLRDFVQGISSSGSEMNWMQLLGCCDPRMLISVGIGRVTHAFHLLQTDPAVKRLVISLASDRALWEAIMNNDSVRSLRESLSAENGRLVISEEAGEEPGSGSDNLWWFLGIVREKILELLEKFKSLVNEIFQQQSDSVKLGRAENKSQLEEQVRSSLLLSVVILLVVVLARVRGA